MNFLFTTEIVLSYRVIIKRLGNPYCNRWQIGNRNKECSIPLCSGQLLARYAMVRDFVEQTKSICAVAQLFTLLFLILMCKRLIFL